nr:hypothetical protein [Candidatus Njordarchaeum guaymaensis]
MASSSDNSMKKKVHSVQITVDGVLCYYEDFGGKEEGPVAEPLLVTGLLSAMAALVREITKKGVLRKIESPPVKFFASQAVETPQVIISMFTDISFPDYLCDIVLGDISEFFLEKYVGCLVSWTGENLTMELSPYMRKIVEEDIAKYSGGQPVEAEGAKNPAISRSVQNSRATTGL